MAEDADVSNIGNGNCENKTVERSSLTSKNLNQTTGYPTLEVRLLFTQLRKAFTKALIFWHFDPECHVRIETNMSGYTIGRVLSQLTLDNLGQWHPIAFYSRKIIPAKTRYKTHNGELFAIVEAFKTWRHYLEGCKHKVLFLINYHYLEDCKHKVLFFINYNNLCCFIDIKNLSFHLDLVGSRAISLFLLDWLLSG